MSIQNSFEDLKINMLCVSCNKYYGTETKKNLCSKCFDINILGKKIRDNNFYKNYILSKKNFSVFPDFSFTSLVFMLKNISTVNLKINGFSNYGDFILNRIQYARDLLNENNEEYINYMLSDEQSFDLINKIRWNDFDKGYLICHAIWRNRIFPWSNYKYKYYDQSSFCYYGNFLELPDNENHLDRIISFNLSNNFVFI